MTVYHTTLRGTIQTGTLGEIFSHSMGIESGSNSQTVAEAVREAWRTAFSGLENIFNTQIQYTEATAAPVLDPTVPDLGAAWHAPYTPPIAGLAADKYLPPQNALAISLTAGTRPDGRPFKGRFYLPPLSVAAIDPDGMLPQVSTDNIALIMKTYLETLMQAGHWPSIWSRVQDDLVQRVTQVRVGNKIDTIRSRRNRYPEVYSVQAILGPQ